MLKIPVVRWGKPYESLDSIQLEHFLTGEPVATLAQANSGLVSRDLRKAARAREVLRELSCAEIIQRLKTAADLYRDATLPLGDGSQSPDEFVRAQSATTGLPEHLCRANMQKNHMVLSNMDKIMEALTRGLDLKVLSHGYGVESRGVMVSYQAQSPVLGLVLPSNSPGVHTLWLPVVAMQIGLLMKPGSQEIWTPYRIMAAFEQAGIPAEAMGIYPGPTDVGAAVLAGCQRSMIFGSEQTVDRYKGDPRVQVHGPGWSKIILGDDLVDQWEDYLDLMEQSVFANSGRGCINCSTIWASRHTEEIAQALAERLGPVEPLPPEDPNSALAAFTVPGVPQAVWKMIESDLRDSNVKHLTEPFGPRLVERERCAYLRPVVAHAASPDAEIVRKEYMFPFVTVVKCPQEQMLAKLGPTLVCTAITADEKLQRDLTDAVHIDRLNVGPIPTIKLDWLQPHEGNIVEFLFRARAYQVPPERLAQLAPQ